MRRPQSVATANAGISAIHKYCDDHGLSFLAEPREDYGVDCYVEVCEDETPLNFVVAIQSKSGSSYRKAAISRPGKFQISVKQEHTEYWSIANIPVIFTYLDENSNLWWKHVQHHLSEAADREIVPKHIEFDIATDLATSSLATYLRQLQHSTPNTSHRLAIIRAKKPLLSVGGREIELSGDGLTQSDISLTSPSTASWAARLDKDQIHWTPNFDTGVVGMSTDGRWIGYVQAQTVGAKCRNYSFHLLDRVNWAEFYFPVYTEADHDKAYELAEGFDMRLAVTEEEMAARVSSIEDHIRRANLAPVGVIAVDDYYSETPTPVTPIAINFGGLHFTLAIEGLAGKSYLHLYCDQFTPKRAVKIVAAINKPEPYDVDWADPSDDMIIPETQVKVFNHVKSIFISQCARFLTLLIGTNEENLCWGSVDYTFVHLSVLELRDACLECIGR